MPVKATILLVAAAHASVLVPRNCGNIPSSADPDALDAMYGVLVSRGISDKALLATFEAAWVESHVNCRRVSAEAVSGVGHRSAVRRRGAQHERVVEAVQFNEARYPHFGAGMLAQNMQYSEYAKRYHAAESKARHMLSRAQRRAGQPAYQPDAHGTGADGANLAPGSLSSTCGAFYSARPGDGCTTMGGLYGASAAQLVAWNPSLTLFLHLAFVR
ncbi:hypothetical protein AURDEDRAFT_175280 [Auricularia subglabra TFB-10046 SS5]|uniref:LysM domain-containing protein n=1 Tax=Auricularia subglabra (strain TFB-10046 / SS5) TaxID=717982 RepID=J0CXR2_AURST|nr:hypothetical protein AURDEDRAFT_175280 [Auricularia subglabra TFB-10046 SS5]